MDISTAPDLDHAHAVELLHGATIDYLSTPPLMLDTTANVRIGLHGKFAYGGPLIDATQPQATVYAWQLIDATIKRVDMSPDGTLRLALTRGQLVVPPTDSLEPSWTFTYVAPHATRPRPPRLPRYGAEILTGLRDGRNFRQIAGVHGVSYTAMRIHCQALYAFLGVHNKQAAVAAAIAWGLIDSGAANTP